MKMGFRLLNSKDEMVIIVTDSLSRASSECNCRQALHPVTLRG